MNLRKYLLAAVMACACTLGINAQTDDVVSWDASVHMVNATVGYIQLDAKVTPGAHFYALEADGGGYNALSVTFSGSEGITYLENIAASEAPVIHSDEYLGDLACWEHDVTLTQNFEIDDPSKDYTINVNLRYQACVGDQCYMPQKPKFELTIPASTQAVAATATPTPTPSATAEVTQPEPEVVSQPSVDKAPTVATPAAAESDTSAADEVSGHSVDTDEAIVDEDTDEVIDEAATADTEAAIAAASTAPVVYQPIDGVDADIQAQWWAKSDTKTPTSDSSPWGILLIGFIGGLAALLTPCVWPLIPMTLSFFLKQNKGKNAAPRRIFANKNALIYGASIIIIYVSLGLLVTILFGASKLNELSTNAVFNIFLFLLLVVFAISFFGAFDIKLPSKWSNYFDSKAENAQGLIGIFFMAFTLAIVSFSCTGPIIGTLLAEAASNGDILAPAMGMGGFAIGLALPFTICAFFPSMLNSMPKSGGWLNTVKVVLGFIELILSLKFLSVADLAYGMHILDRETFVAIWIVLFALLGLYLLGKIRFPHDDKQEHTGVWRFVLAIFPLSFAVYLLPGLWGAPLKSVSAFVPPLSTQDFNLYVSGKEYPHFDDYDQGMKYAMERGLPVLLDFSGYGCVNCRNMEAAVIDTSQVRDILADNFVVITLMVDSREPLAKPYTITDENGNTIEFTEVGEKWSYLQLHKFNAQVQPYYIVLDNYGNPMCDPSFYDNNVDHFISWLNTGLDRYNSSTSIQ